MKNSKDIVDKLNKDVEKLQNKIDNRKFYNFRNIVIKSLLKSGIVIDYALPFIIAAIVICAWQSPKKNPPFHIDKVTEKAKIETIDTSSGNHVEHVSFDFSYGEELIEHSTGWIINNKGLYERIITSYRLNDKVNLEDTDKILKMTKEEIEELLVITNVKTIKKNCLTPEDSIYNEDAIIVINHLESEDLTLERYETKSENVWHSIWWIVLVLCWGNNFRNIEKLFVKTYMRDKLREVEPLFRKINKDELETMKKILEVKQENLAMLDDNSTTLNKKETFSYKLRRI